MGFLAAPTGAQLANPGWGCCADCGLKVIRRVARYTTRGISVIVAVALLAAFIAWFTMYM